jgi:hypothetical protein
VRRVHSLALRVGTLRAHLMPPPTSAADIDFNNTTTFYTRRAECMFALVLTLGAHRVALLKLAPRAVFVCALRATPLPRRRRAHLLSRTAD